MSDYTIAKYIRLSIEEDRTDSLSIENQRLILDTHIAGMELPDVRILEFVDNGYSGTNYERPAVQELIELVRQGGVDCVIVKDFSRFGRSMIDTAYYIERVFPLYRTRFISLSDNFDSSEHAGGAGGLDVTFQFLLHEQYSRDLSQKIRSARRTKAERGELITKNCAFGFKKVRDRLEIDEPAAETVWFIFNLAAQGMSYTKIAARLYEERRPTPGEYKNRRQLVKSKDFTCLWSISMIQAILSDEQYIGTYVAGKSKALDVGSGKLIAVDPSVWIRIPNHHPSIVDKEVFDAVKARIQQRSESRRGRKRVSIRQYMSPLRGKVVYSICGHMMQLSQSSTPTFHCHFTRAAPDVGCYRLKISAAELEATVFRQIREQAILISECGAPDNVNSKNAQLRQPERTEDKKRSLYEPLVLAEINADDYRAAKACLDAEHNREKRAQTALTKDTVTRTVNKGLRQLAEDTLKQNWITKEFVEALIDKVLVYPGSRIEVVWKASGFGAAYTGETSEPLE